MSNIGQQGNKTARVRGLFVAALVLGCTLLTVTNAAAQKATAPAVPDDIKVPAGNSAFLTAHAYGSQGYTCLPTSTGGTAWNVNARPEATLFVKVYGQLVQVI